MYEILSLDHPLFRDFKGMSASFDATICFPPGTGGNFLGYRLTGGGAVWEGINEYKAANIDWLSLETLINHDLDPVIDLDACHAIMANGYNPLGGSGAANTGIRLSMGHRLPVLTQRIYGYHTEELITIEMPSERCRLIGALLCYKMFMTDIREARPITISDMLYRCPMPPDVAMRDYDDVVDNINAHLDGHGIPRTWEIGHTPMFWMWYTNCVNHGVDRMSIPSLRKYVTNNLLGDYMAEDPPAEHSRDGETYQLSKASITCASRLITVDYDSLFFDLDHCGSNVLSRIDRRDIHSYSASNMAMLESVLPLVEDDAALRLRTEISSIRDRLAHAKISHGIDSI